MRSIFDLNNRLFSRELLKTVSSNIRKKQHITRRHKILNLHKVVINFNLSNAGSILANSSFGNIYFASNKDDWENSNPGTIYKNSDQTPDTGANIECKQIKKRLQKGKK